MAAPVVQDLQALIAELGQSITPQKALIDQSIEANTNAGAAQEQGLGAQRDTAFKQIDQGAQNKGMYFSGASPDEQYKYTAGTYLPALANLQATIASTRAGLLGKKADLDTDVYQKAFSTRENQTNQLNAYNNEQEARAFQAEQARIAREAAAAEAEKDRRAAASTAAANRAASNPAVPTLSKNKAGGWEVSDSGMDLAGYARATGKDLITLLLQGDAKDRQAANWYLEKINKYGADRAPEFFAQLQKDRPTAFYRGG